MTLRALLLLLVLIHAVWTWQPPATGKPSVAAPLSSTLLAGYYSTTFAATENPISESSVWTNGGTVGLDWQNVQTGNGRAYGIAESGQPPYDDATAVLKGTWSGTQWAASTAYITNQGSSAGTQEIELRLLTTITANSITGYEVLFSVDPTDPYVQFVRWYGPLGESGCTTGCAFDIVGSTTLGTGANSGITALATGDVMSASVESGVFHVYKNGQEITLDDNTDTAYTTGYPGIGFWKNSAAAAMTDAGWSDFVASDGGLVVAASCSQANVATAIAAATAGETVLVPPGTCSWSGNLSISGISLIGPGKDATSPTTITAGKVTLTKHASAVTRLIGFRFTGTDAHLTVGGSASNQPFMVHNNYFVIDADHGISIETNGGVISENDFIGPLSLLQNGGNAIASTLGATAAANSEWAAAPTFGTLDTTGLANTYVEDNVFTNLRDGWDCDDGSKMVFRYNTLNDSSIITHGGGSVTSGNDSSQYGCRQLEIYNNTFNRINDGINDGPINRWVWFRGSSGVVTNNVMDEANSSPNWTSGQQVLLSVGCDTGSYPRQYQVGQSTQSTDATPDHPILISGNTGFGVPSNEIDLQENPNDSCASPSTFIQSDRDYVTTNTWSWTAYIYPHPLRAGIP